MLKAGWIAHWAFSIVNSRCSQFTAIYGGDKMPYIPKEVVEAIMDVFPALGEQRAKGDLLKCQNQEAT